VWPQRARFARLNVPIPSDLGHLSKYPSPCALVGLVAFFRSPGLPPRLGRAGRPGHLQGLRASWSRCTGFPWGCFHTGFLPFPHLSADAHQRRATLPSSHGAASSHPDCKDFPDPPGPGSCEPFALGGSIAGFRSRDGAEAAGRLKPTGRSAPEHGSRFKSKIETATGTGNLRHDLLSSTGTSNRTRVAPWGRSPSLFSGGGRPGLLPGGPLRRVGRSTPVDHRAGASISTGEVGIPCTNFPVLRSGRGAGLWRQPCQGAGMTCGG
jgi:hypothetical protein